MIGRRVTCVVKWILCENILVISQRQAHVHQLNGTHAIFCVSYFNGKYVVSY